MRKPIMAANWKMNKTVSEAVEFANDFKGMVADVSDVEVVVCAPFTCLYALNHEFADTNIRLGAENVYFEEKGAFTGEISPAMVAELCEYVIIGHSERRKYFGETDEIVNKKIRAALNHGLNPIVCIGESLEEREHNKTFKIIEKQLKEGLVNLTKEEMLKITLAYEPIWAIGTGKTATPEQAQEVHKFIRDKLNDMFGEEVMQNVRIQYGGSMKPENVQGLMAMPDIDGGLIGGASLQTDTFSELAHFK